MLDRIMKIGLLGIGLLVVLAGLSFAYSVDLKSPADGSFHYGGTTNLYYNISFGPQGTLVDYTCYLYVNGVNVATDSFTTGDSSVSRYFPLISIPLCTNTWNVVCVSSLGGEVEQSATWTVYRSDLTC